MRSTIRVGVAAMVGLAAAGAAGAGNTAAVPGRAEHAITRVTAGVTPADVMTYPAIAGLAVSPDGRALVYVLETANAAGDGYTHRLFLLALDGKGAPRRLSADDAFDDAPEFSPDSRYLAFRSDEGQGAQLRVLRLGARASRAVTAFDAGVGEFSWAPDSSRLVFSAFAGPAAASARAPRGRPAWRDRHARRPPERSTDRRTAAAGSADETAPIVIDRILARRDGEGWLDDQRSKLWIVGRDGGKPVQLTSGRFDDGEPRWSPDGTWIAFTSNRDPDPDLSDNTDIYLVRPDGRDARRFAGSPGPDERPAWSRTGDRLAWLSSKRPNDYYSTVHLMTQSVTGAAPLDLTADLDTWVAEDWVQVSDSRAPPQWSSDDATIFVPLERRGTTYLAAVPSGPPLASGPVREVHQGAFTLDFVRYGGGANPVLVFAQGDAVHPSEIYALPARPDALRSAPRRLTSVHERWLAGRAFSQPQRLQAQSRDGAAVEAWLYPPLGLAPGKRYPLIVYLHGGPQAFDGDYFDEGLENQVFATAGWGVLRVNYRGSTSYGEQFSAAIRADWHRREYEDIMAAVDQASTLPWVDPARLAIGGWSYGGIMTVWTVAHTERFRAAAPERFEVDYLSAFGQDHWVAQYLAELGDPAAHEDLYRRLSPITYAAGIKTPLLLIAGDHDYNCPLPQALELYERLKVRGATVELVVYPGESHTFSRPDHLRDRLERLLDWFGSRLRN